MQLSIDRVHRQNKREMIRSKIREEKKLCIKNVQEKIEKDFHKSFF